MSTDLPPQLARLYALLEGGEDVPIADLHASLLGKSARDSRHAQQIVGSYVVRLNRRLKSVRKRVEPGKLKQTYVLCRS